MPLTEPTNSLAREPGSTRRALVVAPVADAHASGVEGRLAVEGYEVRRADAGDAAGAASTYAPDVVIVVAEEVSDGRVSDGGTASAVALVRRLRSEAATFALPVVLLFREDAPALRGAASGVGVDDYFALAAPVEELRARLEALFWRVEAGRRSAPLVAEQRAEIDNFLLLLDGVRADAEGGAAGTIALVGAGARGTSSGGRGASSDGRGAGAGSLGEAYGFLKLNLRRADAVAFYGPTLLFAYLPRVAAADARATLARLFAEFEGTSGGVLLFAGLASFPADGADVEHLIEIAERRLDSARPGEASASRVVASENLAEFADAGRVARSGDAESGGTVGTAPASAGIAPASEVGAGVQTRDAASTETPSRRAASSGVSRSAEPVPTIRPERDARAEVATTREARMLDAIDASTRSLLGERRPARDEHRKTLQHQAAPAAARARARVLPRRLLLTVSDAALMARLNLLIRSAGVEVRAAFDARQALNLLRIERPDLVVVDYALSDMDGVEMLRRLSRQSGGKLMCPAVLLVPGADGAAREEAAEIGARSVASVPYNPEEILDAISADGPAD